MSDLRLERLESRGTKGIANGMVQTVVATSRHRSWTLDALEKILEHAHGVRAPPRSAIVLA